MKWTTLLFCLALTGSVLAQNHEKKAIRFIFESIHDHLGNLDVNSKRVQLFDKEHRLLYEADLYDGKELDEQFFYYGEGGRLERDHRIFHKEHESGDYRMTYDAKGNKIKETNVNDLDEVLEEKNMTYNDKGQMITEKVAFLHHMEDKMIMESEFEFTYGEDGKLATKKGWENEKRDVIVTYKYEHADDSETIKKYDAKGQITEKWVQKFDKDGKILQDVHAKFVRGMMKARTIDFEYDEQGHILTETMSKTGSSVKKIIKFEYTYDEYGNWTERKETKTMGAKKTEGVHLKRHIEYYEETDYNHPPMEMDESFMYEMHDGQDYKVFEETHVRINNNNGDLEWVVRRNGQALYQVDEFEYTKDGRLEKIVHLTHEHKDHAYTLAKYNDNGQLAEEASYSHDGSVEEKTTYEYDGDGNLVQKEESIGSKVNYTETYEWESEGILGKMILEEMGVKYVTTYEYSDKGKLTKEVTVPSAKDEEVTRIEYKYNAAGGLTTVLEFEGKKSTEPTDETRYTFDDRGELIKKADYRNGKIHSEVDFVYFE